jgi:membrane associated rhomboid family serine protease
LLPPYLKSFRTLSFSDDLEKFLNKEYASGYLIGVIFLISSIGSLLLNLLLKKSVITFSILGASNEVFGLLAAYFFLNHNKPSSFCQLKNLLIIPS